MATVTTLVADPTAITYWLGGVFLPDVAINDTAEAGGPYGANSATSASYIVSSNPIAQFFYGGIVMTLSGTGLTYGDGTGELPTGGMVTSMQISVYASGLIGPVSVTPTHLITFAAPVSAAAILANRLDLSDLLYGGADSMVGGNGVSDVISGYGGNDSLFGVGGNDTLDGGTEHDLLFGGTGNDRLLGQAGNDTLRGGSGTDTVLGGSGADSLTGDTDNDSLSGGTGNDTLAGGAGIDTLSGGWNADRFVFSAQDLVTQGQTDRITDFSRAAGDRIDLSGIDANALVAGDQAFTSPVVLLGAGGVPPAGSLRYTTASDHTTLYLYTDADAAADFMIRVNGTGYTPVAADFVL
jgi:Ca2+-binding RTX toxin-like protein